MPQDQLHVIAPFPIDIRNREQKCTRSELYSVN